MIGLYVDHISPSITTLGPGRRIGLWVQGCSLRCKGCMSVELFERRKASYCSIAWLTERIISYAQDHAGLTISGGEPFEQAESLKELLENIHKYTSLDIMVYSGYTKEELLKGSQAMIDLLNKVDILIDGRFEIDLSPSKPWCGSDNQTIYLLSKRVQKYRPMISPNQYIPPFSLQVEIADDDYVRIIGIPRRGELELMKTLLLKRGIELKR